MAATDASGPPIVEMTGVTVTIDGTTVLREVDFRLFPGEIHALMGGNGAGKSSLVKALTGAYRIDAGELRVDGEPVVLSGPAEAEAAGIAAAFQDVDLCGNLSIAENVMIGHEERHWYGISWRRTRRRAVEVLIQSLDRADQDRQRELLPGISEAELYEAALTVMMRLVFLFCAEERDLLASPADRVYWEHYSVSTVREQLQQTASQYGEEILERRHDAWCRLLVAFRAVHGGVWHDDLKLPAYGGRLFDPDRFPFLEGRKPGTSWRATDAVPLPVNNRTVLHLLESLQTLETRLPGDREVVRRRLSFRSLDIEQIGHVYEGLLDHTASRASEPHEKYVQCS